MMCNLYPYKIITLKISLGKFPTVLHIWSGACGRSPQWQALAAATTPK